MSTEELWQHSLSFLQEYAHNHESIDRDTFYKLASSNEFSDILSHHGKRFKALFAKGDVNLMIIYTELIQMMLEREEKICHDGFQEAFNVHKIEGFMYLNTRSQTKHNKETRSDLRLLARANAAHETKIEIILEKLEKQEKKIDRQDTLIAALMAENKEMKERMENLGSSKGHDDRLDKIEKAILALTVGARDIKEDLAKVESAQKDFEDKTKDGMEKTNAEVHDLAAKLDVIRKELLDLLEDTKREMTLRNAKALGDLRKELEELIEEMRKLVEDLLGRMIGLEEKSGKSNVDAKLLENNILQNFERKWNAIDAMLANRLNVLSKYTSD